MQSNHRGSTPSGQPDPKATRPRSKFGRAFSDVWASLGGRSSQEQADEEAVAEREAAQQLARAREVLQQDRASTPRRRDSTAPCEEGAEAPGFPEQTGTRPSRAGSPAALEIAAWIEEAVADLPEASVPIEVMAEAGPSEVAPTGDLALAATERATRPAPVCTEPIRTRTMARLLGTQGYRDRALSIYDFLLAMTPHDASLRAEAQILRDGQAPEPPTRS